MLTPLNESRIDSGRVAPGIGISTGELARCHAIVIAYADTPFALASSSNALYLPVPTAPGLPMPPIGDHGKNAIPFSLQISSTSAP